jgi:NitT/TauT family transport system ATP-binding protein
LAVRQGEFVSVIGPSGAGKTTLLRAIGGLLRPTSGTILVEGILPSESQRRRAIGFVFQEPALLPWRTVFENILLPLELNTPDGRHSHAEAERLLTAVGLAEFRDYHPHQLSGGMKQRVALARALAFDPSILLMDEPFGALDEMTRTFMRYELLRLWEQSRKTVLFVTHSISEAILLSDRVVVLSGQPGRIVDDVAVALPRPREADVERSQRFFAYADRIMDSLARGSALAPAAAQAAAGG